jgi:hypothetical protein
VYARTVKGTSGREDACALSMFSLAYNAFLGSCRRLPPLAFHFTFCLFDFFQHLLCLSIRPRIEYSLLCPFVAEKFDRADPNYSYYHEARAYRLLEHEGGFWILAAVRGCAAFLDGSGR